MKSVKIGDKHLYNDFNLIMNSREITPPSIKKETIDVPGSDGVLDFSESLTGDVKYNNRTLTINLTMIDSTSNFDNRISELYNYLHGKKFKIIFDDNPEFYYIGRSEINSFASDSLIGLIVLECDVEPYKYDIISSNVDWPWDTFNFENGIINETKDLTVDGELEVSIYGRRKHVVPIIESSTAMQVVFNSQTYNLVQGSNEVYDIEIIEGENKLKFIGNGTVNIDYRGGSL